MDQRVFRHCHLARTLSVSRPLWREIKRRSEDDLKLLKVEFETLSTNVRHY